MIPEQILNPSGCGSDKDGWEDDELFCSNDEYVCGENEYLCKECKNIQKAQAQTLLDEKKNELEFLKQINHNLPCEVSLYKFIYRAIEDKIQELKEDIKVLEEAER